MITTIISLQILLLTLCLWPLFFPEHHLSLSLDSCVLQLADVFVLFFFYIRVGVAVATLSPRSESEGSVLTRPEFVVTVGLPATCPTGFHICGDGWKVFIGRGGLIE